MQPDEPELELDVAEVVVGVDLDERISSELHVSDLASRQAPSGSWITECRGTDELEHLIAADRRVRVERAEIDDVTHRYASTLEVGNEVVAADADVGFVERIEVERVVPEPAGQGVETRAAGQRVVACAADDGVVAAAGYDNVVAALAIDDVDAAVERDRVIALAADDVLDAREGVASGLGADRRCCGDGCARRRERKGRRCRNWHRRHSCRCRR